MLLKVVDVAVVAIAVVAVVTVAVVTVVVVTVAVVAVAVVTVVVAVGPSHHSPQLFNPAAGEISFPGLSAKQQKMTKQKIKKMKMLMTECFFRSAAATFEAQKSFLSPFFQTTHDSCCIFSDAVKMQSAFISG